MKKTTRISRSRVGVVLGLTAITGVAGCELLVDFDRSLIDSGLGDASFTDGATQDGANDVTLADTSPGVDSSQDSATDSPMGDDGSTTDGGDGATGDAADGGDGATADANDAGEDAADAADAADTAPTPASLSIAPVGGHDFTMVDGGTTSPDFTFTVTNSGGTNATGITVTFTGTNGTDFNVGATNTCTSGGAAANNGTCMVSVNFTPSQDAGAMETATLNVTPATGTGATAALSGTAN